jgi:hypothetical protein
VLGADLYRSSPGELICGGVRTPATACCWSGRFRSLDSSVPPYITRVDSLISTHTQQHGTETLWWWSGYGGGVARTEVEEGMGYWYASESFF